MSILGAMCYSVANENKYDARETVLTSELSQIIVVTVFEKHHTIA